MDHKEKWEAVPANERPCKRCRPDLLSYDPAAELAEAAKALIDQNFAQPARLREKVNALGVTRRHLTQVFEKQYDTTPEQYTAQRRLLRAKELLEGGSSVTDTAFAVGMESPASFSAFFKKQTGVSPADYAAQTARPHCFFPSPLGTLHLAEDGLGITRLHFTDAPPPPPGSGKPGLYLAEARRQIGEYFAGSRRDFDLPLSPSGSGFQKKVWQALREIPYGETRSYQQIARRIGSDKAARAVGGANNRNPILILIPCHRVLGKSGKLVGFAAGMERKQFLLDLEKSHRAGT